MENNILQYWKDIDAFAMSNRKVEEKFIFLDGPPFATGTPHYGHLLAGTIKDVVCRYQTMLGKQVGRRFGIDCHGLPIESIVMKALGWTTQSSNITNEQVKVFNDKCRSAVNECMDRWKPVVERMGRWVDFKNGYSTMDTSYMETVMWVFKQIWNQKRIYRAHRIMPYSPRLMTTLSNFEVANNYRDVEDPAVIVKFKVHHNLYLLVYTTTPWTLPANLAICVNPTLRYDVVEKDGVRYVVGASKTKEFFKDPIVSETLMGADLIGWMYEPLFIINKDGVSNVKQNTHRVLGDSFVLETEGTGIVHLAPAYGEDDYRVCKNNKINLFDVLDEQCNFDNTYPQYSGKFCKDIDQDIIAYLKEKDRLFSVKTIKHSYPYCDRTNVPLIYRAVDAWYVKLEDIKDRLVSHNDKINWIPKAIGENRFGNWLREAKDWNISRNRLWGSCIPVWVNENGDPNDAICIGSIAELEELSCVRVTDLHKDTLDNVVIKKDGKVYRRVPEVLDCWFESGCAPLAQNHYPFENNEYVEQNFPVDFVAEGLDQTRGWYYTLLVISTLLFDLPPFRNVIVNGLVLADDGQKMSKSKNNYTDPMLLVEKIGADAIRGYLCSSAATHAEPLNFKDADADAINRNITIPLLNATNFFTTYRDIEQWTPPVDIKIDHILDRWIDSKLQLLVTEVTNDLNSYVLSKPIARFTTFLDELNNWYIRCSRKRFWKGKDDGAFLTLSNVLLTLAKTMAPFLPFVSEEVYRTLNKKAIEAKEVEGSVHLCRFPTVNDAIDTKLNERMATVSKICSSAHKLRAGKQLPVRQPLSRLIIFGFRLEPEEQSILMDELNVKTIEMVDDDLSFYDIVFKPNFKTIGKKFGRYTPDVSKWITNHLKVGGLPTTYYTETIEKEDVLEVKSSKDGLVLNCLEKDNVTIALDVNVTDELKKEGYVRNIISALQKQRKESGFNITDRIQIQYTVNDKDVESAMSTHISMMTDTLLASSITSTVLTKESSNFVYRFIYRIVDRTNEVEILFNVKRDNDKNNDNSNIN